ncbi:uncharacterized protein LOC141641666 [Silene latifolia]|uniref:uncharacterized protein LOC141641666 n=1 Tax=Silene latifolia TaxID=37657 RepID=UPI003D7830F9
MGEETVGEGGIAGAWMMEKGGDDTLWVAREEVMEVEEGELVNAGKGEGGVRDKQEVKSRKWVRVPREKSGGEQREAVGELTKFIIHEETGDWRVTGFYGWPVVADRHLSWKLLRILGSQSSLPWMCIGDYNEILFADEMKGGQRAQWQMNNFREAVDNCGLADISFEGYKFTWDNGQAGEDNRQSRIDRAMEESASQLQAWKRVNIGKIVKAIATKRRQIERLNEGDRTVEEVTRRRKLVREVADLIRQEEQFWRQRSRALWLKERDRNTGYFHRQTGQRRAKNYISKLVDDEGIIRSGAEVVSRVATSYFRELFRATPERDFGDVFNGLEGRVSESMNEVLRQEYREEEVVEALNQIHPLKAPGPDGMNGLFYQTYWHIVGLLVLRTVLGILNGSPMPSEINHTHIVLIPKKKAPDKIRDFRPISLCNVVYKLVSKVLANRLKQFLSDIVSDNQSAFTPGRMITDNVLIAFELFHYMNNSRSGDGHMALKLDMAKAYDRVEWDFLEGVLRIMGFEERWINRVMTCVSTVSLAVLINGNVKEVFSPERASEEDADMVSSILRKYEYTSGQLVNLEKTTVSFSRGVSQARREAVAGRLRVGIVVEQERYLGLPTVVERSKKPITDIVRKKLNNRLQGWRGKILSRAGREVRIKVVANSLPTYVMSVFKLPLAFVMS